MSAAACIAALRRLVEAVDALDGENGDRNLFVSPGCVICTSGTTPYRYDTGLCAYHEAQAALLKADEDADGDEDDEDDREIEIVGSIPTAWTVWAEEIRRQSRDEAAVVLSDPALSGGDVAGVLHIRKPPKGSAS